jgi:hypothetical protein
VHDEDEQTESRIKVVEGEKDSQVSDSEVRDDEDEFAYSEAQLQSINKDVSPYSNELVQLESMRAKRNVSFGRNQSLNPYNSY